MELVDYLYVDDKRLDSYMEQLGIVSHKSGSPGVKVAAGPLGFTAEASMNVQSRLLTRHEKIEVFTQHIVAHDRVGIAKRPDGYAFLDETYLARRCHFPTVDIAIWMGEIEAEEETRGLILIEGDLSDGPQHPTGYSAYSQLSLMAEELELTGRPLTVAQMKVLLEPPVLQQISSFASNSRPMTFEELFVKAGAKVGPRQRIRAIYRLRASSWADHMNYLGYPVFIELA